MKFKITISKYLDEEITADNEEEAWDIAWEMFSQDDEAEAYCYEVEE